MIQKLIDEIIRVEGDQYVNHPDDKGGPTKFGITLATLSKWRGTLCTAADVEALSREQAETIYWKMYVTDPGFDRVATVSEAIGAELVDTGVNMGQDTAARFLQRCLNALNDKQKYYPDLKVDGRIGSVTVAALSTYLAFRNETVMLKALNCLQGERYVALAEAREKNESFVYGWLYQRVKL